MESSEAYDDIYVFTFYLESIVCWVLIVAFVCCKLVFEVVCWPLSLDMFAFTEFLVWFPAEKTLRTLMLLFAL